MRKRRARPPRALRSPLARLNKAKLFPRVFAHRLPTGPSEQRVQVTTMTEKQRVLKAVEGLPDDATVEDAIERLCFIAKVKKGISELDAGQGVPHEEVKRRVLGG